MKSLMSDLKSLVPVLLFLYLIDNTEGAFNRCFKCRSRGDLGSCKDPFKFNASALEGIQGVDAIPCTSGWCGKILDRGSNSFKDEEYGAATERLCLQRGPDDNEERCAPTTWGHEKVYMCFCQGDLCNAADKKSPALILLFVLIGFMNW
ncbi:QVR superfamily protein rtv [Rhodnius prolixus]|uniref:QVR superfamily protein rtv n=1 Tax=Rhodnius prolixus TaxID=13249 RepID=UPI003D18CB18